MDYNPKNDGLLNRSAQKIRADLDAWIKQQEGLSDYTSTLPGSLVEDVLSTSVATVIQAEQIRAETLLNLTPAYSSNNVLKIQARMYGFPVLPESPASIRLRLVYAPPNPSSATVPAGIIFKLEGGAKSCLFSLKDALTLTTTNAGETASTVVLLTSQDGRACEGISTKWALSIQGSLGDNITAVLLDVYEGSSSTFESYDKLRERVLKTMKAPFAGGYDSLNALIKQQVKLEGKGAAVLRKEIFSASDYENFKILVDPLISTASLVDVGKVILNNTFDPAVFSKSDNGTTNDLRLDIPLGPSLTSGVYPINFIKAVKITLELKLNFTFILPKSATSLGLSEDAIIQKLDGIITNRVETYIKGINYGGAVSLLVIEQLVYNALDGEEILNPLNITNLSVDLRYKTDASSSYTAGAWDSFTGGSITKNAKVFQPSNLSNEFFFGLDPLLYTVQIAVSP